MARDVRDIGDVHFNLTIADEIKAVGGVDEYDKAGAYKESICPRFRPCCLRVRGVLIFIDNTYLRIKLPDMMGVHLQYAGD